MNESRSSRYQRARRRTAAAAVLAGTLLLTTLVLAGGSTRLRDAVGGSVWAYACLLAAGHSLVTLPFAWYRGYRLERRYELSQTVLGEWLRDYVKSAALTVGLAAVAATALYAAIGMAGDWWWLAASVAGAAFLTVLTVVGPVLVLPIFHRFRPLAHERLRQRLLDLSARAGISVLSVHEWSLGDRTRRVGAALVGAGATRRILLSDTLLAGFTDDEIEVVLAHEIGHHVHRDVLKGLAAEFTVLVAALYVAARAVEAVWRPLGFRSPADVAALPVVVLVAGAVMLAAAPLLNAWSRRNERRADQFALELTSRPDAFIAAMRRMALQNLAEEHPSRAARWFFNTHPSVEERIGGARRLNG